jgi:hypothetical protein
VKLVRPNGRCELGASRQRCDDPAPDVSPQPVPDFDGSLIPLDAPLSPMARWLVGGSVELARGLDRSVPEIPSLDDLTGAEGLAIVHETVGHLFPGLRRAG